MAEPETPRTPTPQLVLLCMAVLLAPLVAGKLAPIPALSIQALAFIASLAWLVGATRSGRIVIPRGWTLGFLIVFMGWLKLSAWHSASVYLTTRELFNFGSYLMVFLMVAGMRDHRSISAVLASLGISALVVGLLGLKEYILSGSGGWRVFSTFFNPDFLAGFAVMVLPVMVGWYLSRTSASVSAVSGLIVLLMAGTILITGSRFGAVAAVIGILAFIILAAASRMFTKAHVAKVLVILVPLIIVQVFLSRPLTARVASTKTEMHSGGFRLHTWKGTARMVEANPVHGTGLGTFAIAYPKYADVGYTKLAHNTYLQLAAEAGIPSAIALVLFLGVTTLPATAFLLKRRVPSDPGMDSDPFAWMPETGLILSGLIGGAFASMARNLVDSDWCVTGIGIGFWAMLGAVVAVGGGSGTWNLRLPRKLGIIVGVALVPSILVLLEMLAAETMAALGDAAGSGNPESAARFYRMATKINPYDAESHRRLGGVRLYSDLDGTTADDAAEEFRKAVSLEPGSAKNYYQLARVMEVYREPERAISAYRKALECDPNAVEVMLALARLYERTRQPSAALPIWRRMVEVENSSYERIRAVPESVSPEYAFAHLALGQEAERTGDRAGAMREFTLARIRAERYLESARAMKPVLEVNGRRDRNMEKDVALVKITATQDLERLSAEP